MMMVYVAIMPVPGIVACIGADVHVISIKIKIITQSTKEIQKNVGYSILMGVNNKSNYQHLNIG